MPETIKSRLLKFISHLGIGQTRFEKNTGISNGLVNNIGDSLREATLAKISATYPALNLAWLKTGEGPMLHSTPENYTSKRRNDKLIKRNRVPLYDAHTEAGNNDADMTPIQAPAGTIDVGDLLHDSEAAIRIYGNSMIPNYPPGCVVGLVKCTSGHIEPGEVYVIETRDGRKLKRLFYKDDDPESDTLILYSDNTLKFDGGPRHGKFAYPLSQVKKEEITQLFAVTGVIKRNANSVIMNRDRD